MLHSLTIPKNIDSTIKLIIKMFSVFITLLFETPFFTWHGFYRYITSNMSGCAGVVMNAQHKGMVGKKRVHRKFERT